MYKKFLNTIFIISTIPLSFLECIVPAKAMWEELDDQTKENIRTTHITKLENYYNYYYNNRPIEARYQANGPDGWQVYQCNLEVPISRTGVGKPLWLLLKEDSEYHQDQWNDNTPNNCNGCKTAIENAYFKKILPRQLTRLTIDNTQLQQRLAETLLEVEELKDDIQRLKTELRIATLQPSSP